MYKGVLLLRTSAARLKSEILAPRNRVSVLCVAVSVTPRTTSRRLKGGEARKKTNKQTTRLSVSETRGIPLCFSQAFGLPLCCAVECTQAHRRRHHYQLNAQCLKMSSPVSKRLQAQVLLLVGTSPLYFRSTLSLLGLLCLGSPLFFGLVVAFQPLGPGVGEPLNASWAPCSRGSSPRRSNRWAQLTP